MAEIDWFRYGKTYLLMIHADNPRCTSIYRGRITGIDCVPNATPLLANGLEWR